MNIPMLETEAGDLLQSASSTAAEPVWLGPGWRQRLGIARYLDATLLRADASETEATELCDVARGLGAAAVCLNSIWIRSAAHHLKGSDTALAAVVDFPLGASSGASRRAETRLAVLDGASEIDLVASLGLIKTARWGDLYDDLASVIAVARPARVKVILETAALTVDETMIAGLVAREAGADWLKTSTGFHAAGGATVEAVRLLRLVAGTRMGVKASGGIRSLADAARMLLAGADRIGASALDALSADRPLGDLLA
jgi:deoxyribose-phosphate aldolase